MQEIELSACWKKLGGVGNREREDKESPGEKDNRKKRQRLDYRSRDNEVWHDRTTKGTTTPPEAVEVGHNTVQKEKESKEKARKT